MSEIMEPRIEEQPGERPSWSKVWINVITRPSTKTFEWILCDQQARPRLAYAWLFFSCMIGSLISILVSDLFSSMNTGVNTITCGPIITAIVY